MSPSNSGQNEEAAELLHEMKAYHIPMKLWYNDPVNLSRSDLIGLKSKYGEFPMFWKDLVGWDGWRDVRREYLRFIDISHTDAGHAGKTTDNTNTDNTATTHIEEGAKRRSRWANDDAPDRKRKSRWATRAPGPPSDPVLAALGLPSATSSSLPPDKLPELHSLQSRLRIANHRLANLESESNRIDALPRTHPDRSPSPPPVYNPDGSRKNTRAARWREKYTEDRAVCLERIMELSNSALPSFLARRKRSVRISIPVDEHPSYNFIGLIIGPRGKTQKDMENKTGCKIAIRGRGSVKEGARGRLTKQVPQEGDDEPLHVVITGEDPNSIEAAAEMVRSMLVVIDDEKNVHKQNQLRELALLNGTLKEAEEWCITCGEKGHKNYECPKRFTLGGTGVSVKCAICGESSHPTRDCMRKDMEGRVEQLDEDYTAFMAELDGAAVAESVLTILQPARVVKKEECDEVVGGGGESWITTISSTVPKTGDMTTSITTGEEFTGVTTISSTLPKVEEYTGVTTISSTIPGVFTDTSGGMGATSVQFHLQTGLPPPPPPTALPSAITNGIVPDFGSNGTTNGMIGMTSLPLPPPPMGIPPLSAPPPVVNAFLPPPPPPPGGPFAFPPPAFPQEGYPHQYQQPGYPPQPYGQYQQPQWGGGTAAGAWDPNSYYDPTGGGFNWWDESESG